MTDTDKEKRGFLRGFGGFALLIIAISSATAIFSKRDRDYSDAGPQSLMALVTSEERPENHKARDQYRHPLETLTFFNLKPEMKVVEIFPGGPGGFYRRIIEPYVEGAGGAYYPVNGGIGWPSEPVEDLPYGQIDMVLVFRAHGFLIYGDPAQDHVDDLFKMLKPGGYLGIVDHAGDESLPQDPEAESGYVNASYFRAMAEKAGFEFVKESDVNRNPKDTKDHPDGLYSLPPSLRSGDDDKYRAIGESDRFTHLYRKPVQ